MSSAALTSPPMAIARLVVDTDVASYVFKWHPEFAPRYVGIIRGSELVVSFMTLAEMRQGALDANWGRENAMCWKRIWQTSRYSILTAVVFYLGCGPERERAQGTSNEFGRCVDSGHRPGSVGAARDEQS